MYYSFMQPAGSAAQQQGNQSQKRSGTGGQGQAKGQGQGLNMVQENYFEAGTLVPMPTKSPSPDEKASAAS